MTRRIKLKGPLYWAKVFEHNRDTEGFEGAYKDHDGACTVEIDLDEANYNLLKSSGSMKKGNPSPDNEGMMRVKFLRKFVEEPYAGGAPVVKDANGNNWNFEELGYIGNGSDGAVILDVYPTKRKSIVGTRLIGVDVYKLVPVESTRREIEEVTYEDAQESSAVPKDIDDEIPF